MTNVQPRSGSGFQHQSTTRTTTATGRKASATSPTHIFFVTKVSFSKISQRPQVLANHRTACSVMSCLSTSVSPPSSSLKVTVPISTLAISVVRKRFSWESLCHECPLGFPQRHEFLQITVTRATTCPFFLFWMRFETVATWRMSQ